MEEIKQANFLDTNHMYQGTQSKIKKYFFENVAEHLRTHLLENFTGNITVTPEKIMRFNVRLHLLTT